MTDEELQASFDAIQTSVDDVKTEVETLRSDLDTALKTNFEEIKFTLAYFANTKLPDIDKRFDGIKDDIRTSALEDELVRELQAHRVECKRLLNDFPPSKDRTRRLEELHDLVASMNNRLEKLRERFFPVE